MNADIKISKGSFSDLDSVLALQNKIVYGSHAKDSNELSKATQSPDSARIDYENYLILKAECKDELVGCVKAKESGEFCWIEKLIVSPQFQKMGIGTSLMNEVEKAFPNTRLYLLCTGYRNPENLEFYESLGYKKRELSRDGHSNFLLIKTIKQNLKS
jgi:ribosomal protein S18 acetylase RimI-like enzyme